MEQTFQAALTALNERRIYDAERLFRAVIRDKPKHIAALNLLTVLLMSMERFAEAEEFIEKAVKLNQNSDVSFYNYGTILKRLGKATRAKLQFDKAIQLNPNVYETWNNRGTVFNDLKQYDLAVSDFDKAISLNPNYCDAFCNKGKSLFELKRYDDAFAAYDKALALKPNLAEAWFGRGNVFFELKLYDDALAAYDKTLALKPDLAEAWLCRGNVFVVLKQYDDAAAAFDKALTLKSDLAEAWLGRGNVFFELKQYDDAFVAYDKALALAPSPDFAQAWLGRGKVFFDLKRYDDAFAAYGKALALKPDLAEAWLGRGNVFFQLKRYDDALAAFDKALELKPDLAEAWLGHGNVFFQLMRYDDALSAFDKALALKPDLAQAWLGRGSVFAVLKRYDDAFVAFEEALALKPDLAEAWLGRGNVFFKLKRYDDAVAAFDKARALKPDLAEAWLGHGNVFFQLMRYDDALSAFDKALELKPDLAEAWVVRGTVRAELRRYDEGLADCDKALELKPDLAEAWLGRGNVLFSSGRNDEALAAYGRSIALKPDLEEALSNKIFALDFSPDASLTEQQDARHDWWRRYGESLARSASQPHDNSRDPDRRLVIGYVSADFRQHSAARAFGPILRNHDKKRFEITCYTCSPYEDQVTNSFRSVADTWREVSQLSDEELAQQIRSDRIDILVDLSGHSRGNRLKTFARKPAPVQVTAWGHATGTGIPAIDYLFSDPVAIPKSVRHLFAEQIIDLPCAIITERLPQSVLRNDPPALKNGYCTFGFFNRAPKASDEAIKTWADILTKIPDAKLLMKDIGFDAEPVVASLRKKFSLLGISSDRIRFLGFTPHLEHLAAFNEVDICLDPFPQNGGVSTWEALQMGVPVVAKLGATVPSRISGAILASIGMSDWVAEGTDSYVSIAVKNAGQVEHLARLRRELTGGAIMSSVLDGAAYTRAVEAAYRRMWHTYCRLLLT
jgi:predicted O-linked N-acetylglucosamine transferase (SPINDLY family)